MDTKTRQTALSILFSIAMCSSLAAQPAPSFPEELYSNQGGNSYLGTTFLDLEADGFAELIVHPDPRYATALPRVNHGGNAEFLGIPSDPSYPLILRSGRPLGMEAMGLMPSEEEEAKSLRIYPGGWAFSEKAVYIKGFRPSGPPEASFPRSSERWTKLKDVIPEQYAPIGLSGYALCQERVFFGSREVIGASASSFTLLDEATPPAYSLLWAMEADAPDIIPAPRLGGDGQAYWYGARALPLPAGSVIESLGYLWYRGPEGIAHVQWALDSYKSPSDPKPGPDFKVLDPWYALDSSTVWVTGRPASGINPATFLSLGSGYATEGKQVFYLGRELKGVRADKLSIILPPQELGLPAGSAALLRSGAKTWFLGKENPPTSKLSQESPAFWKALLKWYYDPPRNWSRPLKSL